MANGEKVPLKEYIEKILAEKDKAINIALDAAKEASLKTEQAQRDYNGTHNDLLRKMDDQYKMMIPRKEFEAYKLSMETALKIEKERADKGEGKSTGISQIIAWIFGGAGFIAFLIEHFSKK